MRSDITDKVHVVEISEPIGIVYHSGFVLAEFYKSAHLLFKTLTVVVYIFYSKYLSKVTSA